ncbi:hypothetical protein F4803DRAFT_571309 [Xylaria telfairii]|nr:hypothetical protein F4803DRAFT_571309 [Xylaria telfairii]
MAPEANVAAPLDPSLATMPGYPRRLDARCPTPLPGPAEQPAIEQATGLHHQPASARLAPAYRAWQVTDRRASTITPFTTATPQRVTERLVRDVQPRFSDLAQLTFVCDDRNSMYSADAVFVEPEPRNRLFERRARGAIDVLVARHPSSAAPPWKIAVIAAGPRRSAYGQERLGIGNGRRRSSDRARDRDGSGCLASVRAIAVAVRDWNRACSQRNRAVPFSTGVRGLEMPGFGICKIPESVIYRCVNGSTPAIDFEERKG